jgi:cobalt/nickel transport protein
MRKALLCFFGIILIAPVQAYAHFGMIIPSDDIVCAGETTRLKLSLMFAHPFEGNGMPLAKPVQFGVLANNIKTDLLESIKPVTIRDHKAWTIDYKIRKPGVYSFYMEPQPYWEPAEDCYIVHYTKVVLSAFGLEDGWDEAVGLKTEIVPLTRPFGLYAGNVFQGIVNMYGKPVPYAEVEIEFYNENRQYEAPDDSFITQVVKADSNGVFTYAAPKPGWWGFAALNIDEKKIEGKDVEIGAVLWVNFSEMK